MALCRVSYSVVLFLTAVVLGQNQQQIDPWTSEEIQELKEVVYEFLAEPEFEDRAPGCLRLIFHDCVGGCNGCLNLNDEHNNGLGWILPQIDALHDETFPFGSSPGKTMSRADFWNLAAITAIEYSIDFYNSACDDCHTSQVDIPFTYGRQDCSGTSSSSGIDGLPEAYFNHSQTMAFFKEEFGMDAREAVAILGAHTLGGMDLDASGYDGRWKEDIPDAPPGRQYQFNNFFYVILAVLPPDVTWTHFDASNLQPKMNRSSESVDERWMWRGKNAKGKISSMLDVDVSLVRDIDVIDEGGESRCQFVDCPRSPTYNLVVQYATDSDAWLQDFVCAYQKMVSNVPNALTALPKDSGGEAIGCSRK